MSTSPESITLFGLPQSVVTLVVACLAGLSGGTNYVYSSYGPQLRDRLGLSETQVNAVAASANLGMYLTGSIGGRFIDAKGPRKVMMVSSFVLLAGWLGMRGFYLGGQGDGSLFARFGVPGLAFAQILTGVGSSLGNGSAVNGVARSFTPKTRATAISAVVCCTGLSAFFYTTIYRLASSSDDDGTPLLLMILAIGCFSSMVVGSFLIRPALYPVGHPGPSKGGNTPIRNAVSEETPLLDRAEVAHPHENIRGWQLVATPDFWMLWFMHGLLASIGLMYINNFGTMVHALAPRSTPASRLSRTQTSLVSVLSLSSALGRILIGTVSDFASHRLERVWFLIPVAACFVVSQVLALRTTQVWGVAGLAPPTALLGLAYGFLWGLVPVLNLDWFGLRYFASNNGLLVLAPALFSQFTNYLFGRTFDANSVRVGVCEQGRECYAVAFRVTTAMAVAAFVLAVVAGFRRQFIEGKRQGSYSTDAMLQENR